MIPDEEAASDAKAVAVVAALPVINEEAVTVPSKTVKVGKGDVHGDADARTGDEVASADGDKMEDIEMNPDDDTE